MVTLLTIVDYDELRIYTLFHKKGTPFCFSHNYSNDDQLTQNC